MGFHYFRLQTTPHLWQSDLCSLTSLTGDLQGSQSSKDSCLSIVMSNLSRWNMQLFNVMQGNINVLIVLIILNQCNQSTQ